jgi:hypothetical protein
MPRPSSRTPQRHVALVLSRGRQRQRWIALRGRDLDRPRLANGVPRVDDEVGEDLVELSRIDLDAAQAGARHQA